MKPVLTAKEMRRYESDRFADGRADSLEWMERAAVGVFDCLIHNYASKRILVVCGGGNNGGDGFALLRMLHTSGISCEGVLLGEPGRLKGDAKTNFDRAISCGVQLPETLAPERLNRCDVIADAMFGTGLSRAPEGRFLDAIERINASGKPVVAIDIPSGIDASTGRAFGAYVRAAQTVTFQFLKRGHLLFPGRAACGETTIWPLTDMLEEEAFSVRLVGREDVSAWLPARKQDAHKGSAGRALICAGSARYTGAALLATGAALRAGAGLTVAAVPGAVKPAFSALPEAIAIAVSEGGDWDETACRHAAELLGGKQAACIGPGVGSGEIAPLIHSAIDAGLPLVLDADALNRLARDEALKARLHQNVILTPHPAEMARLTGEELEAILEDPVEAARTWAKRWHCVVLLKGATTCASDGTEVRLNITGNPGLAKGGSGDVLSGIVTALLAQGLKPIDAASAGAYLLGASADEALRLLANRMLLAGDVVDAVRGTIEGTL